MIADHVASPLDYGLYGLLAVVMIRELFSLIRFAFSHRKNGGNPGNLSMTAAELRPYLQTITGSLQEIRNEQTAIQTKLDQVLRGLHVLQSRKGA